MLLGNLHTNLGDGVGDLKIRSRGDDRCESAKRTPVKFGKFCLPTPIQSALLQAARPNGSRTIPSKVREFRLVLQNDA